MAAVYVTNLIINAHSDFSQNFYLGDENKSDAQAIGNALGMIIWISQTLLLILLGLLSLVLLPKNYSKENKDEQTELR